MIKFLKKVMSSLLGHYSKREVYDFIFKATSDSSHGGYRKERNVEEMKFRCVILKQRAFYVCICLSYR